MPRLCPGPRRSDRALPPGASRRVSRPTKKEYYIFICLYYITLLYTIIGQHLLPNSMSILYFYVTLYWRTLRRSVKCYYIIVISILLLYCYIFILCYERRHPPGQDNVVKRRRATSGCAALAQHSTAPRTHHTITHDNMINTTKNDKGQCLHSAAPRTPDAPPRRRRGGGSTLARESLTSHARNRRRQFVPGSGFRGLSSPQRRRRPAAAAARKGPHASGALATAHGVIT